MKQGFAGARTFCLASVALAVSAIGAQAQADTLLGSLDFNNQFSGRTQAGAAAIGAAGDVWNASATFGGFIGTEDPSGNTGNTAPFGAFELADPTGAASGISYQMTFTNDGFAFNSAFDASAASVQGAGIEDLTGDYAFVGGADSGETLTFVLSGLQANTEYSVYLYGVGDNTGQGAVWTLNGVAKTSVYDGNTTIDEGADYVKFTFDTGANTTQSFTATELNGAIAVNGFQIVEVTAVPEPSSMVLVSLAVLLGLPVRRFSRG